MAPRSWLQRLAAVVLPGFLLAGCFDEPPLPESGLPVFGDAFTAGFTPNPFGNSLLTALSVDGTKAYSGSASIRLEVPSSASSYTGGAVLASDPQDLSGTNALVFWATASRAATFDEIGFGLNFDPDPSTYRAGLFGLPLTTAWTRHLVPLPDPSKLSADKGVLYYVDTDPVPYTVWLDDVKFDRLDEATLGLQPSIATATRTIAVGGTAQVGGLSLRYADFDGTQRAVDSSGPGSGPAPQYFAFTSSNPAAATVNANGLVTAVGLGQTTITARLGQLAANGTFTVDVLASVPTEPTAAPPAPTAAPGDVISLLSAAYTNVPVDTWRTGWSQAVLTDVTVGGDPMKKYSALDFVGVEFTGANRIDASAMTHFHVDLWTPDATTFRVKLVDAGANGVIGTGGDDSEHELVFTAGTTPSLAQGAWVSLDLPLASFTNLTARANLAQLIFSALPTAGATVWVDNVYFHR